MLLAFSILYLSRSFVNAAPASLIASNVTATQPIPSNQLSSSADQRTIWDILWSCLATIFTCTWVSIHPNIQPPNEKWWMGPLRRLELMMWAILAPELMILWATRQWFGARNLVNELPDGRWTKTHGYFVQMGGFPVFEGDALQGFVSNRDMDGTVHYWGGRSGHFPANKLPSIPESEIRDRSKGGDGLSKSLAIGQTLWFVLQCIARRVDGLYITELELATAAFAFLNGVIYFLWWDKPLAVQCSVPVQLLDNYTERPNTEASHPRRKCSFILLLSIFLGIFDRLIQIGGLSPSGMAKPDSTFYAYTTDDENNMAMICASIAAIIFGGIHCAGWIFTFPSHAESIIWRISSIVITGVPFLTIAYAYIHRLGYRSWKARNLKTVVKYTTAASIPFYMIARLLLLAEAFTTLRNLPQAAFDVVRWVTFIPHI